MFPLPGSPGPQHQNHHSLDLSQKHRDGGDFPEGGHSLPPSRPQHSTNSLPSGARLGTVPPWRDPQRKLQDTVSQSDAGSGIGVYHAYVQEFSAFYLV